MHKEQKQKAEKSQPFSKSKLTNIKWEWIGLLLALIILIMLSLLIGAYDIFNQDDGLWIFLVTRLPRTFALLLSGSGLAMTGLILQLVSQNSFVEATTTGSVEWAGLGLLFSYIFLPSPTVLQRMTLAVSFSLIGVIVFFVFLRRINFTSSLFVPIIGIVIGAVISGISNFLALSFNMSQVIEIWFTGSFAQIQLGRYEYLWLIALSCLTVYFLADYLGISGLGRDMTINLGVNHDQLLFIVSIIVSINIGIIATVVGNLPFIGLIVPNLVRMYRGDHFQSNLPWVAIIGMIVLLFCDILARVIISPYEMPVSLILGIIGSIVFFFSIIYNRRGVQ